MTSNGQYFRGNEQLQPILAHCHALKVPTKTPSPDQESERIRHDRSSWFKGIWQSPIGALEPTGKRFQHEGIRIFRVVDGKLVETWGGADTLSQLQQLGVLHALVAQQDEARE